MLSDRASCVRVTITIHCIEWLVHKRKREQKRTEWEEKMEKSRSTEASVHLHNISVRNKITYILPRERYTKAKS